MQPESSASHTQAPVTCPYPELQGIRPSPRLCAIFHNIVRYLRCGIFSTSPKPPAGGPPLVRCPRPLISVFYRPQWRPFLQRFYTHIKQHKYYNFVYFNLCNFRYLQIYTAPYFSRTWLWSTSYIRLRLLDSHVMILTDLHVSTFMNPSTYFPKYF